MSTRMRTKYVGRPYRCRRCEQHTTERYWYYSVSGGPPFVGPIKVAYFCPGCVEPYLYYTAYLIAPTKHVIELELLALILIG